MRCLVIHAHPDPESYSTALRETAVGALTKAGHDVEVLDLYQLGFNPSMSEQEHLDYYTVALDHPDPIVAGHIELVRMAEMLVFVYPTWWSGMPAMLKGWLDRTMLPGVAFALTPDGDGNDVVTPSLTKLKRLVGITTYGSSRRDVFLLGDAGRRTVLRTVRLLGPRRLRTTWLGYYQLDTSNALDRARFLDKVDTKLAAIR